MIKKNLIALTLAAAFAAGAASAQTGAALLEKGKGHEAKKEYVYALGCYYDAMNAQDAPDEAKKNFDALGAKLRQGSAGLGLSMWDDPNEHWQRVIKDFYKYFTEYAPYEFAHDGLRRGELNYASKTATYLMDYSVLLTAKCDSIFRILAAGDAAEAKKDESARKAYYAYNTDTGRIQPPKYGNDPEPKLQKADISYMDIWIKYTEQLDQLAKFSDKDRQAQGTKLKNTFLTNIYDEAVKRYKQDGIALSAYVDSTEYNYEAWTEEYGRYFVPQMLLNSVYNLATLFSGPYMRSDYSPKTERYLPYDLEFSIYDSDGKLLAKGTRQGAQAQKNPNEASTYVFSGLPEQTMNVIDSGQYTVRLTGAYLMYGIYYHNYTGSRQDLQNRSVTSTSSSVLTEARNDFVLHNELVKKTAEIALDLDKVSVVDKQTAQQGIYQRNYSRLEERIRDWEAKYVEKYIEEFKSFGLSIGTDLVISVTKDSPADKVGYKTGWKVLTKPAAEELARTLRRSEQQNAQQVAAQLEKYWSIGPSLTQQVMDELKKENYKYYEKASHERILSDKEIENCVQSALRGKAYLFIHDNAYYWYGMATFRLPIIDGKKINFVDIPFPR